MTTLHAIFPDPASGHAAATSLQDKGFADDESRRPEIFEDRLYHTPHAGQSAIAIWFLGGAVVCGLLAAPIAWVLAATGHLGVPVDPDAAAAIFLLAGFAMGGLSAALGGSGAYRSDYYDASRDLQVGQVLLTVHVPWETTNAAAALLEAAGATTVHRLTA